MILDNDLDIRKSVQDYADAKLLRCEIKQYVAWVRQNQIRGLWSFSRRLDEVRFEAKTRSNTNYFIIKVDSDKHGVVTKSFTYKSLTLGTIKANKWANNTYTDIIFNLTKDYVEEHNINIRDYKISYKSV